MDGGRASTFATRVGIAKSTVHHWLQEEGIPTLDLSLRIAAQCGIGLSKLLQADLRDWKAPQLGQQLALHLPLHDVKRRAPARALDWEHIERELQAMLKLPTPISVLEAARHLDVEARQLYLRANRTTRQLGERWKDYLARRRQANVENAMPHLQSVGRELLAEGKVTKPAQRIQSQMYPESRGKPSCAAGNCVLTYSRLKYFESRNPNYMARPRLKTETTTLKMTPEVRNLWEQCAAQEYRSLTSMFEVMVRDYAKKQKVTVASPVEAPKPKLKGRTND